MPPSHRPCASSCWAPFPGSRSSACSGAGAIGGAAFQAGLTVLFLLGAGLVLARGVLRSSSRRGWIALGLALVAGMTGNALTGWAGLGADVPELVGIALGAGAFLLSVAGLAFMLADRPSRLPLGAALDGMTGALVAQAVVAAILFSPVKGALQDGFDVVVLLYPLADVLLMGLVAAAVAHGGWRLDFWAVSLAGLVAITIGDSSALATSIVGDHVQGGAADLGWLAGPGSSRSPPGARRRSRTPDRWVRGAVPVVLGTVALGIVVIIAFSPHPLIPALACASGALAVVVGRLAITLHDNDLMLSVARTDSVTDALTGLGNRRQLMTDLEDEVERAAEASPARARALRPQRLQGLQRHVRPSGRRRAARAARRDLARSVDGLGERLPHGRRRVLRPRATPARRDDHAIAERAAARSAAGEGSRRPPPTAS